MTRRDTVRTMLASSGLTVLGSIPPFLLGAQAVLVQRDLEFDLGALGVAVSVFFASAAVGTLAGGPFLRRLSTGASLAMSGMLVATGGFLVAGLVSGWTSLLVAMAVLGLANASCHATSNTAVATALPAHRRGIGFGIKQSAVPAAIMLGGLAVPTMTTLFGWRSTFVVTGAAGTVVLIGALWSSATRSAGGAGNRRGAGLGARSQVLERGDRRPAAADRPLARREQAPRGPLLLCGAAIVLASAAANFLGAYLASWAHQVGFSVQQAGVLVAVGSGSCVVVRVLIGHFADRRYGANLTRVGAQFVFGAVCLALLGGFSQGWAVAVFGVLAFVAGWSWPGLFLYAVARVGREAPTQATSIVQAGAFAGGALGPLLIGLVAQHVGFSAAWFTAAAAFAIASVVVYLARVGFRRDLIRRPPTVQFGYGGGRRRPRYVAGPQHEQHEGG